MCVLVCGALSWCLIQQRLRSLAVHARGYVTLGLFCTPLAALRRPPAAAVTLSLRGGGGRGGRGEEKNSTAQHREKGQTQGTVQAQKRWRDREGREEEAEET